MSTITEDGYTKSFAMPKGAYEPGLRIINGDGPFSPMEAVKNGLSGFWSFVTSNLAKAWDWTRSTLHLDAAIGWVRLHVTGPARAGLKVAAGAIGWTGGTGGGLLLVSTGIGRKVLHYTVGVPVGFVAKWFGKGYRKMMDFHTDHLGGYGNWVADRMADAEKYVWGVDSTSGVAGKVSGFYVRHIASHLLLGSIAMRTARLAGTVLLGVVTVAALPLLLTGTVLGVTTYLVGGSVLASGLWQTYHLGVKFGSIPVVAKWLNETETNSAAAQSVAGVNITTLVEDMATASDRKPAHNPNVRATNPNVRSSK